MRICERGGKDEESERGEDGEFTGGGTAGVSVEGGRLRREEEVVRTRRDDERNSDGIGGNVGLGFGNSDGIQRTRRGKNLRIRQSEGEANSRGDDGLRRLESESQDE